MRGTGLAGARPGVMAAFQHLLQRWGFVRLDRYGLALTPEGRILSTRPDVLDDGAGGRIVGWQDSDLAMAELSPWERVPRAEAAAPPLPRREAPAASAVPVPPRRAGPESAPLPGIAPVIPPSSEPANIQGGRPGPEQAPATFAPDTVMPLAVARSAAVDEDDWEWTIALARARAAAEEIEANLRPVDPPPRSVTQPMATIAMKPPPPAPAPVDYDDDSRITTRPAIPLPLATPAPPGPRAAVPATVIPVPRLPSVHGTGQPARFEPVVRTTAPSAPNRFPKGTAPQDPESELSVGDRTTPGIAMPLAARAVELPSTKGRGTKGRPVPRR